MTLFNGQLTRDWSTGITANLRRTYVSINDIGGWFIYNNTQKLSTNWTRVWESDGVAGPANDADNTQRLVSVATSSVRGANTTTAQSWGLYVNSDGVQFLIAYTGASDDIIRLAYSPGGLYARAGTATFPPTASDEVIISNGNSLVSSGASLDRTMTIWCVDKDWRCVTFRNGSIVRIMALQECTSLSQAGIFGFGTAGYPAYIAGHNTSANRNPSGNGLGFCAGVPSPAVGAAGDIYMRLRAFTNGAARNVRLGGGEIPLAAIGNGTGIAYASTNDSPTDTPAAQGNRPPLMPIIWSGERAVNLDGYWAVPIDWWMCMMASLSTPTVNDFMPGYDPSDVPGVSGGGDGAGAPRTNWLMALGPNCVWPWRDAAVSVDTGL